MARVKDLWLVEVKDPTDPEKKIKRKTARHPDNGGSKTAKRWLAVWIGPDGREKTQAFRIQDAAAKHARKMEEDVERDEYIDPKAGKQTFGSLGKKWLRLRAVGAGSQRRYESSFRLHVEPTFGARQVKSIKPSEVLEWLRELSKKHGPSTQELAYWIVCGILDLAVADGLRRDNPAKSPIIPKPRRDPVERKPWPTAQVWSLSEAHDEPYRMIPVVTAGLGLRQGEAFGLAEDDFDFDAGTVRIRRQAIKVGKLHVFKLPKGGKERTVPMSPGIARTVKSYIADHKPRPYSLPWMKEDGVLEKDEHTCSILFRWHGDDSRTHDKPIQASSYDHVIWKPALAGAGVIPPGKKDGRGILRYEAAREDGMHALRHWFITTLMDAGVSLGGIMDFVGHSKKRAPITVGVYTHATPETFEAARDAIDRSLFRLRAVQDHRSDGTETEQASLA